MKPWGNLKMSNWEDFYKGLLAKSTPTDNGCFQIKMDDIGSIFEEIGYHRYVFGGWKEVYTQSPLTEKEIEKHEQEAKEEMDVMVEDLAEDINKRILKEMGYE